MGAVGFIFAGVVVIYLLLRLWGMILKRMPLSPNVRVLISGFLAIATATTLAGYGTGINGSPIFIVSALEFLVPTLIATPFEMFRLHRIRLKVA